jgi:hypothetical protein
MTYENRRYLIIPTSITGSIDFSQVGETSVDTLRLSVDGTKTFVKYHVGSRPSIYSSDYSEYTHPQILEVLSTEEWTVPMETE